MAFVQNQISAFVLGNFSGIPGIKMILPGRPGNEFAPLGFFYPFSSSLVGFDFRHKLIEQNLKN